MVLCLFEPFSQICVSLCVLGTSFWWYSLSCFLVIFGLQLSFALTSFAKHKSYEEEERQRQRKLFKPQPDIVLK